jgi:hypothetical protein
VWWLHSLKFLGLNLECEVYFLEWGLILSLLGHFHYMYLLWDDFMTNPTLLLLLYSRMISFMGRVLMGQSFHFVGVFATIWGHDLMLLGGRYRFWSSTELP